MTEKEYRDHPAISHSGLLKIAESPEKFNYYKEHPEPPTPSLLFGQLFHQMALQPELLDDRFAVSPNVDRRSKEGKKIYGEFLKQAKQKTVVDSDLVKQSSEMCGSLKKNNFCEKLLSGKKEIPFFWTDEMTGEECKCRVDCLSDVGEKSIIVDLKTCESAETEAFTRAAVKHGYDVQTAMYIEGVKTNTGNEPLFVFIAIEKKAPYAINILQADELFIRRGYDLFREYIGIYSECKKTGVWWGYLGRYNQINNLALPSYLAKEIE